jgi:hypothetical protein
MGEQYKTMDTQLAELKRSIRNYGNVFARRNGAIGRFEYLVKRVLRKLILRHLDQQREINQLVARALDELIAGARAQEKLSIELLEPPEVSTVQHNMTVMRQSETQPSRGMDAGVSPPDTFRIVARRLLDLRWVMALITVIYVYTYFAYPATPGNSPHEHPIGWWGWHDHGEYLKAANAFLHGDLSRDQHTYPPLYPALGAVFLMWSSGHPFFLPDLLCWLWFVFAFIRFADRYVPRWSGLVLLFGSTIINYEILENYVIPWTSTLSMALLATGILGLVWLQDAQEGKRKHISGWQMFLVAISLGLLAATRPADAVVGGVLGLGLLIGYWLVSRNAAANLPAPGRFLSLVFIGFAIGPATYLVFNKVIFGNPFGGYIQIQRGIGGFPADFPEKFISLWLDGKPLYGVNNTGLTEHYPWLFLSLAGIVWALLRGDVLLRVTALAIGILFMLYMPYNELLPTSLWRYKNIHYFKWTFPFLALFAWLLMKHVLEGWRRRTGWVLPAALLVAIPALLLSLHLAINVRMLQGSSEPGQAMRFNLPDGKVDFIDFNGLNGRYHEIDLGNHRILLDGRELKRISDYKLLPLGSEVRLLFIRPVAGREIEFLPDPRLVRRDQQMVAQAGVYRFALGLPKPFRNNGIPRIVSTYRLSDTIDFSGKGDGWFYAAEGWNDPEDWGRWSEGEEAWIVMRISGYIGQELTLNMTYGALVHPRQPCQTVALTGNGYAIATQEICLADGSNVAQTPHRYKLPEGVVSADGLLEIRIKTPDAISLKEFGVNQDPRKFGVGLKTLQIVE